jgi:hypothetical protein
MSVGQIFIPNPTPEDTHNPVTLEVLEASLLAMRADAQSAWERGWVDEGLSQLRRGLLPANITELSAIHAGGYMACAPCREQPNRATLKRMHDFGKRLTAEIRQQQAPKQ